MDSPASVSVAPVSVSTSPGSVSDGSVGGPDSELSSGSTDSGLVVWAGASSPTFPGVALALSRTTFINGFEVSLIVWSDGAFRSTVDLSTVSVVLAFLDSGAAVAAANVSFMAPGIFATVASKSAGDGKSRAGR